MSMAMLDLRLIGVAPLVMHSGRLADPCDEIAIELGRFTAKRKKSLADHHRIADLEFVGGLWMDGDRPCIPAEAIEASICQAAGRRRAKQLFRSAIAVQGNAILEYEGPTDVQALVDDQSFRLRVGVSLGGRRLMRTRPMFSEWSARVTVGYLPTMINRSDLIDVVMIAGDQIGIGDHRPRYGRFGVAKADAAERVVGVSELAARHG